MTYSALEKITGFTISFYPPGFSLTRACSVLSCPRSSKTKSHIPAQTLQHGRGEQEWMISVNPKILILAQVKKQTLQLKSKAGLYQKSPIKREHAHTLTPICVFWLRSSKSEDSRKILLSQGHYCREIIFFFFLTFGPNNVQIRAKHGFHECIPSSFGIPLMWSLKENELLKERVTWKQINRKKKKERKHCQLMRSFVIECRVKQYTCYPARNSSNGKQYPEEGGKILSGNKFLERLGFNTMH